MKKTLLTVLSIVLVIAMGIGLAGCSPAAPAESKAPASDAPAESKEPAADDMTKGDAPEELTLGYIAYDMTDPWNDYSAKAFEYAASQAPIPTKVTVLDSKNSVEESVKCMESLIQQGVDGISIFPISPEQGAQLVKMANDAKIPVTIENISMDSVENPGDYIAAVGCLYDNIGEAAINYIAEVKPGAKIFYCAGQVGGGVYEKYQEGVDRAMAALGDKVTIVGTEHGDWDTEKSMNVTSDFIQSGKEFDYIFANAGGMAKGCYQALKDAGMTDIPIVSTGGNMDDYTFLEEGIEAANMTAPVNIQGIQTFKNLYDFVAEGKTPTEKFQPLPVIPVSSDDLSKFIKWDNYEAAYDYVYNGGDVAK